MKKLIPMPKGWKSFQETMENMMNRTLKMVSMTDLKKAGERAEYLGSKIKRKEAGHAGGKGNG